jgi:dTDP-L-rhamnose 4-epimerase
MKKKYQHILVTGGAGFIGSFLVDELIKRGYKVRILDNLEKQVHHGKKPSYLNKKAEFVKGDVRNRKQFLNSLKGINAIFHLAAAVGVAQSNYEIKRYVDVNIGGTANLLDILVNERHQVKKLVAISSMTGFGEGNYLCAKCGIVRPPLRNEDQLKKKDWNIHCPKCKRIVKEVPTEDDTKEYPNSIYAITKKAQQDMTLLHASLYNFPTVVLRGFNVYGPRQSLSNPYTGVTAIFISRLKNNKEAICYEDGLQSRDFVSVHDVVRAFILALNSDKANGNVINIASGKPTSIKKVAEILSTNLNKRGLIKVNQEFRKNDIRHCFANIKKAQKLLGWQPKISLEKGFKELVDWGNKEKAVDKFNSAEQILKNKGLL